MLIDLVLRAGAKSETLLLQLSSKCITSFLRDGCFHSILSNVARSNLLGKVQYLIKARSSLFERLRVTKMKRTGVVTDLTELVRY